MDRYSEPSNNRFHVWPAGSDSYDHTQNQQNWDLLDAILGYPATGDWPPVHTNSTNGGIYREVTRLQNDRVPIGTIISWFRPTSTTPVPDTWHICDGSVLAAGNGVNHSFPGISGSVTLPDLRNKFILGADPTAGNQGNPAVAVTSPNIDTAAGAPGAQAAGGSNKIVQTKDQLAAHDHFTVDFNPIPDIPGSGNGITWFSHFATLGSGGNIAINNMGHNMTGASDYSGAADPHTSPTGSGSPMDNRPNWYGLIFLCKVLYSTTP